MKNTPKSVGKDKTGRPTAEDEKAPMPAKEGCAAVITGGNVAGNSIQQGSEHFIQGLINRYHSQLMQVIERNLPPGEDAEDIAQEVYVRLSSRVDQATIANERAFLFATARNLIIDIVRNRQVQRRDQHVPLEEERCISDYPDTERLAASAQALQRFEQVIGELPRKCRKVYVLHRVSGMTYSQIARHCRITVSAVEKHMARAVAHVYSRMEAFND